MKYEIAKCEDTQKLALYGKFNAASPGAMSGKTLIAHEEDFQRLREALRQGGCGKCGGPIKTVYDRNKNS